MYFLLQMKQGGNRVNVGLGGHWAYLQRTWSESEVGHGEEGREGEPWQGHNIPMSMAAQVLLPPGRVLEFTQPPETQVPAVHTSTPGAPPPRRVC